MTPGATGTGATTGQQSDPTGELAAIRAETDPVERGRRATELLDAYRARAAELARLRSAAIEEAASERGMSHGQIAAALGISPGRLSQIRAIQQGSEGSTR